jgi:hypothetical protein
MVGDGFGIASEPSNAGCDADNPGDVETVEAQPVDESIPATSVKQASFVRMNIPFES